MKKITVIGGGTGTFIVLSGLKKYPIDLGVIVTMMDSGGSTGRLRDQLGVLPPGDLRQCLVALSDAPVLWRKLFLYRFDKGDLAGHNFGNIFLSALEKVAKNYQEVVDLAGFVLKIKGRVIPVTFEKAHLCVQYENGKIVKGEGNIDKNYKEKTRIKKLYLEPKINANFQAIERILDSDYLIIGPGDLYTSIIPIFLVNKIKESIKKTKAKIIYILNLMTKTGQTTNYKASDHVSDIINYLERELDFLVINNGKIPNSIINWYKKFNEKIVIDDVNENNFSGTIIRADIVDKKKVNISSSDKLVDPRVRSILRHDSNKLAKVLGKIIL